MKELGDKKKNRNKRQRKSKMQPVRILFGKKELQE